MSNNLSDIYLFNPTCEYAVANGFDFWQPNKLLQKMESDLSTLPLFFSHPEDYVIVNRLPSLKFTNSLKQLNIKLPNFITTEKKVFNDEFKNLQKNKLIPWGWSPEAHKRLSNLKQSCSCNFKNSPVYNWRSEQRNLYSKKFALGILKKLISEYPNKFFIPQNKITEICTTKIEIEILLKQWEKLMVKAPWGSSGRGLQPVTKNPVHPKVWEKLLGYIKDQGYAIVEPFHKKMFDLGLLFEIKKGKINFIGTSNFITDKNGQYLGNYLNGLPNHLNSQIKEFVKPIPEKIIQPLITILEKSDLALLYEGFFGVDTLIYLDEKNELKINPCLEINVRQSMGLLSLYLEKFIHPEKKGLFRTYFKPGVGFQYFSEEMKNKYPLVLSNGKIKSGFFPLTEPDDAAQFGAYILV